MSAQELLKEFRYCWEKGQNFVEETEDKIFQQFISELQRSNFEITPDYDVPRGAPFHVIYKVTSSDPHKTAFIKRGKHSVWFQFYIE